MTIVSVGLISAQPAQAIGVPVTEGSSCTDVTIFGMRGEDSTEKGATGLSYDSNQKLSDDFGAINSASAEAVRVRLPRDLTVSKVAVPYTPYDTFAAFTFDKKTDGAANSYRESIASGVSATITTLSDTVAKCPKTKLILIGTGQGAQVAHESTFLFTEAIVKRLAYVWLISDPLREGKDNVYFGPTNPNTASGWYIDPHSQYSLDDPDIAFFKKLAPKVTVFPEYLNGRVVISCHESDYLCSSQTGVTPKNPLLDYSTQGFTSQPALWAVGAVASLCADITFFAARGSGEPKNRAEENPQDVGASGMPAQNQDSVNRTTPIPTEVDYKQGFGRTLASMAFAIESKFPKINQPTFENVAVVYDALHVEKAIAVNSRYPESVMSGVSASSGPQQFRDIIQKCPETKVIMLGYSQGGQVIHEIIMRLTEEERTRIAATVLVADASRNPEDSGTLTFMGSPLKFEYKGSVIFDGMGLMRLAALADSSCAAERRLSKAFIGDFLKLISPVKPLSYCDALPKDITFSDVTSSDKFPDDFFFKVLNVCSSKDMVCDTDLPLFNDPTGAYDMWFKFEHKELIHGRGYNEAGFYDFPSSWAYSRIIRLEKQK